MKIINNLTKNHLKIIINKKIIMNNKDNIQISINSNKIIFTMMIKLRNIINNTEIITVNNKNNIRNILNINKRTN